MDGGATARLKRLPEVGGFRVPPTAAAVASCLRPGPEPCDAARLPAERGAAVSYRAAAAAAASCPVGVASRFDDAAALRALTSMSRILASSLSLRMVWAG